MTIILRSATAAIALAAGVSLCAASASAATDAQFAGFWWDGPVKVQPGVGRAVNIEQGQCLPIVTVAGQMLCAVHANYDNYGYNAGADKVTFVEVGMKGMGNNVDLGFAIPAMVQRITTSCATQISNAILNGDSRSVVGCLPAPYEATYYLSVSYMAGDGSVGICITAQPGDSCYEKGSPIKPGVAYHVRQPDGSVSLSQ
jgi:hypothetical protein